MNNHILFESALGLQKPWFIDHLAFDKDTKRLDIHIDFEKGAKFPFEEDGHSGQYGVYDTEIKTWRHLNFFEHECYLHCRTPRIKMDDNKVRLVSPPWAGLNNGFTLLFEALLLQLCSQMPVKAVSRLIKESDQKIWRVLHKYVDQTRELSNYSDVTIVGMDETSRAKGHDYITLFVDLDEKKTLFVAEGKDHKTVDQFENDLWSHDGSAKNITDISCDMSPAFIKGSKENFQNAEITFDKFHIIKVINKAVDEVRKMETKTNPLLKGSKYLFLKNESNLTNKQANLLNNIKMSGHNLKSLRALQIRESFQEIYQAPTEASFEFLLKKWYYWATHCRLEPIIKAANTIKSHWDGVVAWKRSQINNGVLEGLNSIIQAARSRAKGYRNPRYYKTIVYLITGKLDFSLLNPCVGH